MEKWFYRRDMIDDVYVSLCFFLCYVGLWDFTKSPNVWWYVNAHVFIPEKWKNSSFPRPQPKLKVIFKNKKNCCCCVCVRLLLNLDKSVPNCEQLSSSSPCLATKRKETFWALVSEIKLWIQFSIDIDILPLPLCLSISIFLYFHLSSSSQCFTEHVELEGSFCCCCVCMCVGCVFSIFPLFWAFSQSVVVWCGSRQRRRKPAKSWIGKEDEKTRRRRR